MLRTIIIDDEEHQRSAIEKMVRKYCKNVEVIASADGVEKGIKSIKKYNPDLVLLDIKMKDGTGFDLLERLQPIDFKVIFITAYDQFAIKAFRWSALDYLLKPVDPDELVDAVSKAKDTIQKDFLIQMENLRELIKSKASGHKKKNVKTFDNIHLVSLKEVMYCQSDGNYVTFHLQNGEKIMVSSSLNNYEEMIAEHGFFRVHKSYLVNLKYIRRFEKAEGGFVILENEIKIPVASRKREQFLEIFQSLSNEY